MRISEVVFQALEKPEPQLVQVIGDWIEEYASGHPEAGVYLRRLRDPLNVRVQTLIDVIAKFGTRPERKAICRIVRLALRRRKHNMQGAMATPPADLFSRHERRLVNRRLGNISPRGIQQRNYSCSHKQVVLMNCRVRRAFCGGMRNKWWFMQLLRQLLQIIQPVG